MPAGGGGYGTKRVGDTVASTLKRSPAQRVSHINTKRQPRSKEGTGHLGTLKPLPKP